MMLTWREHRDKSGERYWRTLLWITCGNVVEMAKISGICRQDIYKSLARFNLRIESKDAKRNKPARLKVKAQILVINNHRFKSWLSYRPPTR